MELHKKRGRKSGSSALPAFVLGVVAILIVVGLVYVGIVWKGVKNVSEASYVLKTADVFNFGAAKINGNKVEYTEYIDDVQTLRRFYSSQSDTPAPPEEDISTQVITRLLANELISELAEEFSVEVTNEEIETTSNELVMQFQNKEEAEKELLKRYGWTLDQYAGKVIKPVLLEQKLQKMVAESDNEELLKYAEEQVKARHILFKVEEEEFDKAVKEKAEDILGRINGGADFTALAAEYGTDGTKDEGGDLGWFGRGVMVPEFEEAIFALEPGEINIVKTQFGYHVIKLEEKKLIPDFTSFMDGRLSTSKVKMLINIKNPLEDAFKEDE